MAAWIKKPPRKAPTPSERRRLRHSVYQSRLWKEVRQAIIMEQPICAICGKNPSSAVHHLQPFLMKNGEIDYDKAYSPSNLIGICQKCHTELHEQERQEREKNKKDYGKEEKGNRDNNQHP